MTQRYTISIFASRFRYSPGRTDNDIVHSPFLVDAASQVEAEGIGMRIVRKLYPSSEGWQQHHAIAMPDTLVLTEETAVRGD